MTEKFDTNRWRTPRKFIEQAMRLVDPDHHSRWVDCAVDEGNIHDVFDVNITYPKMNAFGAHVFGGEVGWLNPPYRQKGFPLKMWAQWAANQEGTMVTLFPGSIDTEWFHDIALVRAAEIYFLKGRIHFERPNEHGVWVPAKDTKHTNLLIIYKGPYHNSGPVFRKLIV